MFNEIQLYLPILIPVILLDLILKVICLRHLIRYPHQVKGSRLLWVAAILFIQILGSVAYLSLGRDNK